MIENSAKLCLTTQFSLFSGRVDSFFLIFLFDDIVDIEELSLNSSFDCDGLELLGELIYFKDIKIAISFWLFN